ncbi:hypothetical protein FGO68_gene2490 [Halteria grandinella]|uniref:TLDc domain-containing protein n=1 Tax=Halteria grandinella TaxID=5974 RepID=A0A8J8NKF6_HALGN|nr:hypothetical protein FGO68_gene2490 [Halteria grandinella]
MRIDNQDLLNKMESSQHQSELVLEQPMKGHFNLKRIKSKYIIAIIISYSDNMEQLAPFTHSCNRAFRSYLSIENYVMFMNISNCKWTTNEIRKSILINNEKQIELLLEGLQCKKFKLELLMRGSKDGFRATTFHERCDSKGPTLSVIKSESGRIFGGYTAVSWSIVSDPRNDGKEDPLAFIFTFDNSYIHRPQPYRWGVCHNGKNLCWFGRGIRDLCIEDECDKNYESRSNLGYNYYAVNKIAYGEQRAKTWLAGTETFRVSEIEVFKLEKLDPYPKPNYEQKMTEEYMEKV